MIYCQWTKKLACAGLADLAVYHRGIDKVKIIRRQQIRSFCCRRIFFLFFLPGREDALHKPGGQPFSSCIIEVDIIRHIVQIIIFID